MNFISLDNHSLKEILEKMNVQVIKTSVIKVK